MKTLQELYTEIMGSDALKKMYLEAAQAGRIAEFLRAQGCDATVEEASAFLKEKSNGELSDEELDSVAGGACNVYTGLEATLSVVSAGIECAIYAIASAEGGYTGQKDSCDGRLCNHK